MSWLSEALNKMGGVGKAINAVGGPVVNIAGSVAHALPGVGTAMDVAKGIGNAIPDPFGSGITPDNVGTKMGQAPGLPGVQAAAGMTADGIDPALIAAITKAIGGSGGSASGLPGISSLLTGNSGLNALAAAQLANSAYLGQKSSNFADIAGKNADEAWQQKAPLRAQGVAGMDSSVAPVRLPGLAKISQSGNPFARTA